jgi:hypothetical protein
LPAHIEGRFCPPLFFQSLGHSPRALPLPRCLLFKYFSWIAALYNLL